MLPANVRFKWYNTRADIKLENKYAPLPIILPLIKNMEDAYEPISKVTKKLKNIMGYIYSSYVVAYTSSMCLARYIVG